MSAKLAVQTINATRILKSDYWVCPIFLGGGRAYLKNICYLEKLIMSRRYNRSEQ